MNGGHCDNKRDILVTNVQRMCMDDGPGIRTTIFLKGCNLRCPWCANPENLEAHPEWFFKDSRYSLYGKYYSSIELFNLMIKDRRFWIRGGGVTFSGGEPLLQSVKLLPLLYKLHNEFVHIAFETALQLSVDTWRDIIPYVDLYIVDIKILVPELCQRIIHGDANLYMSNVDFLHLHGKNLLFRLPCNYEYTLQKDNLKLIEKFLLLYPEVPVEIFATHTLGKKKYESLGMRFCEFETINQEALSDIAKIIGRNSSRVTVKFL